jgi:hypothetical protein
MLILVVGGIGLIGSAIRSHEPQASAALSAASPRP